MDLILPGIILIFSTSYCFNHGRFSSLMNLLQINEKEITVKDSTHSDYEEHVYTPKSGVQICKITDGANVIWEDKQKLTQCLSATTITKKFLIHLIHLVIKVTSKKSNQIYYKRLDGKFVTITQKEYDLLRLDPSQLNDTSVHFDITSKSLNDHVFKSVIKYHDGVPTLLVETIPPYKLVSVYDDFRCIWVNRSSLSYVENIIAYFFFARYYLVMLKLKSGEETKIINFMYKDGIWNEVEYYTFMNKFLRLKHHVPVSGYLEFNILKLPNEEGYSIETDEKFGIELTTYIPRRGYILNTVLKGENILWDSANERCISVILLKKQGIIYGINLTLMDNHDERSTLNFVYEDSVYRNVSDEEFRKFNTKLVDPSEYRKYQQETKRSEEEPKESDPEVIIEEPDSADVQDSSDSADFKEYTEYTEYNVEEPSIKPQQAQFTRTHAPSEEEPQQEPRAEPQQEQVRREKPHRYSPPEQERPEEARHDPHPEFQEKEFEPQILDISDHNTRVFLRNSFKIEEVDTYEFLCTKKVHVPSITDDSMLIWDNKKSEKFSKLYVHHRKELSQLVKLVTQTKTGDAVHFFKRHNAAFESIESTEYDTLFEKMGASYNLLDSSILLNLNKTPKEQFFDYQVEYDDGVHLSKFITKSLFKLTRIFDGQNMLWQGLANEKCSCITRNKFYKGSKLIVLNISALTNLSTTKFFKKVDGHFSEISQNEYKEEYNRLKESIPFVSNVTLNLSTNVNESNFLYIETTEGKFTHGKYFPKSGYVLNKVSYGSNTLWSSTRNRCKKVLLVTGEKSEKMVTISMVSNTTPELYFNFVNGKFVKLRNFIEYDFTLKECNKSDSEEDQCSFCRTQLTRRYTILDNVNKIYLNINVDDPNVYTCFVNGLVMNKMFAPKDGYVFTDITDVNVFLFRSKSDSVLCVFVHVFYGNNGPQLVKYRTLGIDESGPGCLYFLEIIDLTVKTIGAEEFNSKLTELERELEKLKESQNKKLLLDISVGNADSVERTGKFKGLEYKEFRANEGYFFSKIIFSEDLVYSLDVDEDCSIVRAYFFADFVVLAELDFVIPDARNSKVFLYRFSNDFITMDLDRFYNLLSSIAVLVSKCVTLELSNFNSKNTFEVEPTEAVGESNLKQKLFSSKAKFFTLIIANESTVWKANSDLFLAREVNVYYVDDSPYLLKMLLQNLDHDETNLFFAFVRKKWSKLTYTEFMNKINKEAGDGQDDYDDSTPVLYDVDITNNINPEHVNYNTGRVNGVLFIEASLKDDSTGIRSVSNKGNLMWESTNKDLICKIALVYYFDNIPQLLKLTLFSESKDKSHLYKHVSNGYWLEIDEDIFSRKLASFESLSKAPAEPEPARKVLCKLDTAKIDTTLVRLTTSTLNKLTYNQYKPLSGGSFIEVFDGNLIWKSDSDQVCNLVRIYFCKHVRVLAKLFMTTDLGIDSYLYFNNFGGTWNPISSEDFESRLDKLDRNFVDEQPTDVPEHDLDFSDSDSEWVDLLDADFKQEYFSGLNTEREDHLDSGIKPDYFSGLNTERADHLDSDIKPENFSGLNTQHEEPPSEPADVEMEDESEIRILEADVNNLDSRYFSVEKGIFRNVPFTKIQAKFEHLITEIRDGDTIVWIKSDKYFCTHAKLFSENGQAKLAEIIVKSVASKMRFLIKTSDGWRSVDEDVFNKRNLYKVY
ncbi:hypothetical protein MACJ_000997 [Theileria orientalis]|uniref:Uncharacterized protein n=1 Tax=Theileria orientalis TaxID=68886 RepID=A0A976M7M4_THEOR|nr:hypothetical protein MACJ_000997 [Theileria orientalis]